MTKHDALYKPAKWKAAKAKAPSILASITPDAEQLYKILGDDYSVIMKMMEGHIPRVDATSLVANVAGTTNPSPTQSAVEQLSFRSTHTQMAAASFDTPTSSPQVRATTTVNPTPYAPVSSAATPAGAPVAIPSHRRGARPKIAGRPRTSTGPAASTSAHALSLDSDDDFPAARSAASLSVPRRAQMLISLCVDGAKEEPNLAPDRQRAR